MDKNGRKISEKKQAYENTRTGVQKAAHKRGLNEKEHKVIKERNAQSGEENEHIIFKGINEGMFLLNLLGDLDNFNMEFNDYKKQSNFPKSSNIISGDNYRRNYLDDNSNRNNTKYTPVLPSSNVYKSRK